MVRYLKCLQKLTRPHLAKSNHDHHSLYQTCECSIDLSRSFHSNQTVITNATNLPSQANKSYYDIPRKASLLPSSLDLILNGGPAYLHEHCDKRHKELGPIYREYLGSNELIFLSDTKLIQTVVANEGPYPHHNVPECWNHYNQVNHVKRGMFFQIGEPWSRLRKAFNKVMLADSKKINGYSLDIININSDLLYSWHQKCDEIGQSIIHNVKKDLCRWSIETTGFMLFGLRMGCIAQRNFEQSAHDYSLAEELVENIELMFSETSRFQLIPVKLAHKLKTGTWVRFESATNNMLRIASDYATENITKAKDSGSNGSIIDELLKSGALSDAEISRSVVDLIIAAADTTSNSLQWMLYSLAKNKDIQDRIFNEISAITKEDFSNNFIEKTPFLRAFMKEVFRLYPTAPFLARTLDRDVVLNSYLVPAGKPIVFSLFTTSRSDKYFEEPLEFKPDRWLRSPTSTQNMLNACLHSKRSLQQHAYASLPFGIGSRMCIGRRAADLEMSLFVASFIKMFECSLVDDEDRDLKVKLNMILTPNRPIRLKLKRRSLREIDQLFHKDNQKSIT